MPVSKPYRRNVRQFVDGMYRNGGNYGYIVHPKYANAPAQYVRAFLVLQKDLLQLFDYIEPSNTNLSCYSYRTHEILLRACIEVEANCTAILCENGYSRSGDWNMSDYKKINPSHHLSSYEIGIPVWHGEAALRRPFAAWASGGQLPWYRAYNETKHNRHDNFDQANFNHMLDAICGLVALLSSQFLHQEYSGRPGSLWIDVGNDGTESAIGGYFRIKFPNDWSPAERYDFDWKSMEDDPDPFSNIVFPP
jgi:hypothetical protein